MSNLAIIERGTLATRDDFAAAITQRWQDSVRAIIDVGRLLCTAKATLPHGEFGRMLESDQIPFGMRTAQRLMKIANHSILSNATHGSHLPPSWRTVYELTKVPDTPLRQMLSDGTIHPETERREVQRWLREQSTHEKLSNIAAASVSQQGRYALILADPPWRYQFAQSDSRKIENRYPTLSVEQISNHEDIHGFIADNCILFLWAPPPKVEEALVVLRQWGFDYKTHAVWDKQIPGMGYYFRQQGEDLLVGAKGCFPLPTEKNRAAAIFQARRSEHSKKPEVLCEIIDRMYPQLIGEEHRIELFARTKRKDWACWGNEWQP